MRIHLVAIGKRMPSWISDGFSEYAQRLRSGVKLELIEVETPRRGSNVDLSRVVREEGARLLRAAPFGAYRIALDQSGRSYDSESLAVQLEKWMTLGRDVVLIVGGPDGLSDEVLASVDQCWSLSPLTLAHPLVRVVIAEQLYRAYAISRGLPYHRSGRVL